MTNETKILKCEVRINLLRGRTTENANIVRKLERQIRQLQKVTNK